MKNMPLDRPLAISTQDFSVSLQARTLQGLENLEGENSSQRSHLQSLGALMPIFLRLPSIRLKTPFFSFFLAPPTNRRSIIDRPPFKLLDSWLLLCC